MINNDIVSRSFAIVSSNWEKQRHEYFVKIPKCFWFVFYINCFYKGQLFSWNFDSFSRPTNQTLSMSSTNLHLTPHFIRAFQYISNVHTITLPPPTPPFRPQSSKSKKSFIPNIDRFDIWIRADLSFCGPRATHRHNRKVLTSLRPVLIWI